MFNSKNKTTFLVAFLLLFIMFSLVGCGGGGSSSGGSGNVSIVNKGTYYQVVLNYGSLSHYNIGAAYGEKILETVPTYPQLLDTYTLELGSYSTAINRAISIKTQLNQDYIDEIDGLASKLCNTTSNESGDGKLSKDELYLFNLLADINQNTECSALAVFGSLSSTGNAMVGRALDMGCPDIQAVVTFKNGSKSICTIGYLGYMGILSGFNKNKIFAAILGASSGGTYSASGKKSYPFDLRYALENYTTCASVASYMQSPSYAVSHLIFLTDTANGEVLENNISTGGLRQVRTASSALGASQTWNFTNAVGCVNSFLLSGNTNSYTTQSYNTARWNAMKTQLSAKGTAVTLDELKEVISYDGGDGPGYMDDGDLYNSGTQQIIIFEPNTFNLQVFFRPVSGLPNDPTFASVSVSF